MNPRYRAREICLTAPDLSEELFEQVEVDPLIRIHFAVREDDRLSSLEKKLPVLVRDLLRIDLVRARRNHQPTLDVGALVLVERELFRHLTNEGPLLVMHLEIRPREGAEKLHEA